MGALFGVYAGIIFFCICGAVNSEDIIYGQTLATSAEVTR